jgi:aminoglycoside phosphotransferase (APT) family kinase protein
VSDPSTEDACRVTGMALGEGAIGARRFTTGLHHFVYEVELAGGRTVVMRMTRPSERQFMQQAVMLSNQLRPLGVPLPRLLASDTDAPFPWMLLERLPGVDLWEAVGSLTDDSLRHIAGKVAAAQAIAVTTPTAGRYGFSATPEGAPFTGWSELVAADIERSRGRIVNAGLFDPAHVERIERIRLKLRTELDAIPATPFLHDTTTKNVIVTTDGTFAGIVDVDDLCYGDPRFVTALTEVALRANGLPATYSNYLMEATGWEDDSLNRLYVAVIFLGFMSEHGQAYNGNMRPSQPEARAKLLGLYEDALRDL